MKLGIGTVQFGLDYGISNKGGLTPLPEVARILSYAHSVGIELIDTALLYGRSEETIGLARSQNHFKIVTKTRTFRFISAAIAGNVLRSDLNGSLERLGLDRIYGLLIHNSEDLLEPKGSAIYLGLCELKQEGLVEKIGVSVYTPEQIVRVIDSFEIDLVQLPISILDQRMLQTGCLRKLEKLGIEVHARSVFLQGVLLMDPQTLPSFFAPLGEVLLRLHEVANKNGCSVKQMALKFVTDLDGINHAVCGLNNLEQLRELVALEQEILPTLCFSDFAVTDPTMLNPALWKH